MSDERRQFAIDVKVGESVSIDRGRVILTVVEKSGRLARLAFSAEKSVPVNKIGIRQSAAEHAREGLYAVA